MKIALLLLGFVALTAARPSTNALKALLQELREVVEAPDPDSNSVQDDSGSDGSGSGSSAVHGDKGARRFLVKHIVGIFNETLYASAHATGELTLEEVDYLVMGIREAFRYLSDSHHFIMERSHADDLNEVHRGINDLGGRFGEFLKRASKDMRENGGKQHSDVENLERLGRFLGDLEEAGRGVEDLQLHSLVLTFRTLIFGYGSEEECAEHLEDPGCFLEAAGQVFDGICQMFEEAYNNTQCNNLPNLFMTETEITEALVEENMAKDMDCIVGLMEGNAGPSDEPIGENESLESVSTKVLEQLTGLVTVKANVEMSVWPLFHIYEHLAYAVAMQEGHGPSGDGPKGDGPKGDGPKGDGPKGDGPKGDGPKGDGPKPDGPKPDGPRPDGQKPGEVTKAVKKSWNSQGKEHVKRVLEAFNKMHYKTKRGN